MEKLIAACGLDCTTCNARIATLNNDDDLRAQTAEQWSKDYQSDIKASDINCVGCMQDGIHLSHCLICKIRLCVYTIGVQNCAECANFPCENAEQFFQFAPIAKKNLMELRK